MSKWKVTHKSRDVLGDGIMNIASLGAYGALGQKDYIYWVENVDTGEEKKVRASDNFELGERISESDFIDD